VERATQLGGEPREAVVVDRPKLSDVLFAQTQEFVVGLLMTGVLLFFLLSAPDSFLEKLVSLAPRLQDKKRVVAAVREVESEVSRYLIAISAINAVFGLAVGAALYGIGVPNAALWGVLAMLTNFVPYVGALAMAIVLTAVGVLSFEAPSQMFLPMGVFVGLNVVEANLVTPMLVGRTLTLSPVVVFVWVLLWSWLWGIPGGLIAVPLLATTKIVLQHIPPVAPLARMMD
jgi:predicted PurR-regulated permease PerM